MSMLFASYAQTSAQPVPKNVTATPKWGWNTAGSAQKPAANVRRNASTCRPLPDLAHLSYRLRESHTRKKWFPQPLILYQHIELLSHIHQQRADKGKLLLGSPLPHLPFLLHVL